jgi:quinol-cytochrome oxidoreductase complex cytochrome b subunit
MERMNKPYFNLSIASLVQYFSVLTVAFHDVNSLYGFFLILIIVSQLISGTMVALSLIQDPMIVPIVRDEEDLEDLYTDDFFWIHERGVDLIFIFSWIHLLRKLYINAFEYEHEVAWKSGVFSFLVLQAVTFLGLVLCCTHLSEITLTIAANIVHTFVFFTGKVYWWIFTNKELNSDTLLRLSYLHYISGFFVAYISVLHGIDMHYDWKNETSYDGLEAEMIWWDEALANELGSFIDALVLLFIVCWFLFADPEAVSYEIFMWGDIGLVTDVRFYGVAPHWYFRPFMAWLIVCPHHKMGIFGLVYLFWILFHQPTFHGTFDTTFYVRRKVWFLTLLLKVNKKKKKNRKIRWTFVTRNYFNPELSLYFQLTYALFLMSCLYASSFLPYGRFYNRLNGNIGMLGAYMYILCYLTFPFLRRPFWEEYFRYNIYHKALWLSCVRKGKKQNPNRWRW